MLFAEIFGLSKRTFGQARAAKMTALIDGREKERRRHGIAPAPSFLNMIIPHHYGITIHEYCRRGKENLYPEIVGCRSCVYGGRLRRHGHYERNALSLGASYRLFIPRYLCPVCGRTCSILPSFLLPRFQYVLAVIHLLLRCYTLTECSMESLAQFLRGCGQAAFSYQLLSFYRKRLLLNRGSITATLAELRVELPSGGEDWVRAWASAIATHEQISSFHLNHHRIWRRSFLSS